jgi:glycosyltransferase involved in cell wall biosynthesis
MSRPSAWVVVPAHDEAASIVATLDALAAQDDPDFVLLVVDNASLDATPDVVRHWIATVRPAMPVEVLHEAEKGVGCAVDSGFRYAVAHGAVHLLRTDADCLPRPDWVRAARAALASGTEMAAGRCVARRDETGVAGRIWFVGLVGLAAVAGPLRNRRGPLDRQRYVMTAGNNMAITADLYQRCGGMPRRPSPTDRAMVNRARQHSDRIRRTPTMVVENSLRRLRSYGVRATAAWYLDRGTPQGLGADVR